MINYCEVLNVSKTDLPYIDSNKVTGYNPVLLAKDGDIIIADTAEDETVCKATELYNIGNAKVVSGLHTMWCRPKNDIFAPKFLGYYINSPMFHHQIIPLIQGIKVSSVSKNAIKNNHPRAASHCLCPHFYGQRFVCIGSQAQEVRADKARHDAAITNRKDTFN